MSKKTCKFKLNVSLTINRLEHMGMNPKENKQIDDNSF